MHDKLGINSFLVQPIQRLPKYQLLLHQLIKELGKTLDEDGVKDKIAACCRAEKHIQRLLDRVNDSMSINDIEDCVEVNSCTILTHFFNISTFIADKATVPGQIFVSA